MSTIPQSAVYPAAVKKRVVEVLIEEVLDMTVRGALPADEWVLQDLAFATRCDFQGDYNGARTLALHAAEPPLRRSPMSRVDPSEGFTVPQLRRALEYR